MHPLVACTGIVQPSDNFRGLISSYSMPIIYMCIFTYLFKNGLGLQVIVFRLQSCLSLPRTSNIYYNQLAELVVTFLDSECYRPKGTSTRGQKVIQ